MFCIFSFYWIFFFKDSWLTVGDLLWVAGDYFWFAEKLGYGAFYELSLIDLLLQMWMGCEWDVDKSEIKNRSTNWQGIKLLLTWIGNLLKSSSIFHREIQKHYLFYQFSHFQIQKFIKCIKICKEFFNFLTIYRKKFEHMEFFPQQVF